MRVVSTDVEELADGMIRVITTLAPATCADQPESTPIELGEGPTRDKVPDKIVRFLLTCGREGAKMSQIQRAIGGNPATANRQVWTIGTGQPDMPSRLRGWVEMRGEGRYALTDAAWDRLRTPEWSPMIAEEIQRALASISSGIEPATAATRLWQQGLEDGQSDANARVESDQAIYELVDDARQANLAFGEIKGWEVTAENNSLINALQRLGMSYRAAINARTPAERLRALEDLAVRAPEVAPHVSIAVAAGDGSQGRA